MLSHAVTRHIDLRRALGFKFRVQATLLRSYADFAAAHGDEVVQTQTVEDWAKLAPSTAQRRNRLLTVRRFARELHAEDPRHQVPPVDLFGRRGHQRRVPHIYTKGELTRLFKAAAQLGPQNTLRPVTYSTLFALLAATGLRISEALALTHEDITNEGLAIRETKFRKSRLIPIHDSTRLGLQRYVEHRMRPTPLEPAVFVGLGARALSYSTVSTVFLSVSRSCGLRGAPGKKGPRLHDMRHTFAVRALEHSARYEGGVARHITALSTYLGHAHVFDTYWYLDATPTLMKQIAADGEALLLGRQP